MWRRCASCPSGNIDTNRIESLPAEEDEEAPTSASTWSFTRRRSSFKGSKIDICKDHLKKVSSETSFASAEFEIVISNKIYIQLGDYMTKRMNAYQQMDFEVGTSSSEAQMMLLQEQLVSAIIENQNLAEQLQMIRRNGNSEKLSFLLAKEKDKNRLLQEKLQEIEPKEMRSRDKSLSRRDKSPRSHSRGRFGWKKRGLEKSKSLDQSDFLPSLVPAEDGDNQSSSNWQVTQAGETKSDSGSNLNVNNSAVEVNSLWNRFRLWCLVKWFDFMEDLSQVEEEEQTPVEVEGAPLTVKKLRENVLRFTMNLQPISELTNKYDRLLKWKCPLGTFLIFVIYMGALLYGCVLPLICLLCIWCLSKNYLNKRGWTTKLFGKNKSRQNSEPLDSNMESKLGDKFAVVLQVAKRVQNLLGTASDGCEKFQNLLMWEHKYTRTLYFYLWLLMGASFVLTASQLLTILGIYLGFKLFIVDFIFFRFPRIRLKYESQTRLWDTLPTAADLERRKLDGIGFIIVPDVNNFLALFDLPATETPLLGWLLGKRCTLVNRDKSITGAFKNGRLYLTNSYLCFERSKSHPSKNITIAICDIVTLEKANSYTWIPGGGMAIEVYTASGKVYFFGGIMNRDEVFDAILDGCRRCGTTIKKRDNNKEKEEEQSKENEDKEQDNSDKDKSPDAEKSEPTTENEQNSMEILDFMD